MRLSVNSKTRPLFPEMRLGPVSIRRRFRFEEIQYFNINAKQHCSKYDKLATTNFTILCTHKKVCHSAFSSTVECHKHTLILHTTVSDIPMNICKVYLQQYYRVLQMYIHKQYLQYCTIEYYKCIYINITFSTVL